MSTPDGHLIATSKFVSRHLIRHLYRDIKTCVATRFVTPTKHLGRDTKIQVATSKPVPSNIYVVITKFALRHKKTPISYGHVVTSRFMSQPRYPFPRPSPATRSVPVSWVRVGAVARCYALSRSAVRACTPAMHTPRRPCHNTTCSVATQSWKWAVAPSFGPLHIFFLFYPL